MRVIVGLVLVFFVSFSFGAELPNDGKYFWCSQLYNPYYPLNPTNVSLPFVNRTFHYTPPSFRALPASSLISGSSSTADLLLRANETGCIVACTSVYVEIYSNDTNAVLLEQYLAVDYDATVTVEIASLNNNQRNLLTVLFYDAPGGNILDSQSVYLDIFDYNENQVSIEYASQGLQVYDKPWFPVGFYFPWNEPEKYIMHATDEMRNNMQSPLPKVPPTPPTNDFLNYMDLAGRMRMRVYFDMHDLVQSTNTPEKWYL